MDICLTERNVLTLSSATIKKFYETQHLKKASKILKFVLKKSTLTRR